MTLEMFEQTMSWTPALFEGNLEDLINYAVACKFA
jgi:hypothetical protein